ncbi:leucine-rich repeat and fibronectin type III domain-containing protein 1-like protein [Branchiostoma floridae x Branchiostoma belcheri]
MECNMTKKPAGVLMFLLVILKVLGTAEAQADCSSTCSANNCDCSSLGLTSVPQDLPRTITELDLGGNRITTLSQSDFSRYTRLRTLRLDDNLISTINSRTFSPLTNLNNLDLSRNRLTSLRSNMFTGQGNLNELYLNNNQIDDIQVGTFDSTPQVSWSDLYYPFQGNHTFVLGDRFFRVPLSFLYTLNLSDNNITTFPLARLQRLSHLYLGNNQMKILPSTAYEKLSSISDVNIANNPWQCDCRMVDFRLKMTGSFPFENQITCSQPNDFYGQSLIGINPEDLICKEPTIARFQTIANNPLVQGKSIHLVCEASGIPTPDITVILPSGLNVTVDSGGEVNVPAAGLYVCIAVNLAGSTFATLVVDQHTTVFTPTVTSPLASTTNRLESTTDQDSAITSPHVFVVSSPSKQPKPAPSFSLLVLLGAICGSIAGTLLIGGIILVVWCKRNNQSPPKRPDFSVVFNNTNTTTTVITNGQELTTQAQSVSLSSDVRNPHLTPRPASSQFEPYEEVQPPLRGAFPSQTARGQALPPPNYESPPVPPPRTASATGYANIPEHTYQTLAVTRNQPDNGQDTSHHYQPLRRT